MWGCSNGLALAQSLWYRPRNHKKKEFDSITVFERVSLNTI